MPPPLQPPGKLKIEGCYLLDASNKRYLNLGYVQSEPAQPPVSGSLAGFHAQLERALREALETCSIRYQLSGTPPELELEFAGQENASAARILQAFQDESQAAGILAGEVLRLHPAMTQVDVDLAERGLRTVAQRLRTLLIEHNSYLSGGLRYPFPETCEGVAERGLATYRFPQLGEVDVVAEQSGVRISFAAAELGEVTSSGFYLPTLFGGDFSVELSYELGTWRPCAAEAACFALFAQNESSSHRYYAQRMSTGDQPHRILASMAEVLSPEQDVEGIAGRFRVQRQADTITCWHGSPDASDPWTRLGSAAAPEQQEMILGAKIWSKIRCGGLEARVSRLCIDGQMADRQIPPVEVRPDPRSNPRGES